jgi:hypothetical protein
MTNFKGQSSNEPQISNGQKQTMKFSHLEFIWHLPACAKPRLPKPCAADRRYGGGGDFDI